MSYILIAAASVGLIAVGAYLDAPKDDKHQVVVSLLVALGTTGFAAAIITAFVGRRDRRMIRHERDAYLAEVTTAHEEHLELVEKSVFQAVLRSTIGAEVAAEVKRQVFDQPCSRRDFHLIVALEVLGDKPDLVDVSIEMRYKLRNLANQPQEVTIRHSLDDPAGDLSAEFTHVEVVRQNGSSEVLTGPSLAPFTSWHRAAAIFEREYTLAPAEEVSLVLKGKKHQRRSDQYVWHSYTLVEGFRCTTITSKALGITVFHELLYPGGYRQVPEQVGGEGVQEWNVKDAVLLMYQGIQLRWVPSSSVNEVTGNDARRPLPASSGDSVA